MPRPRLLTVTVTVSLAVLLLACVDPGAKPLATKRGEPEAPAVSQAVSPATAAAPAPAAEPAKPEPAKPSERERLVEEWRGQLEEKADSLSKRAAALEAKLAERAALYNRWVKEQLYSRELYEEVQKLKRDTDETWAAVAKVEDEISAGPPAALPVTQPQETKLESQPGSRIEPAASSASDSARPSPKPPTAAGQLFAYSPTPTKTVHVQGHYRGGKWIAPYTRSSPKR